MATVVRFSYRSATAKLTVWDEETATLGNVFSIKRGRGHGNGVMEKVVSYADNRDLTLLLEVQQFHYADKMSPDNAGLRRWYAKFGFVDCGRGLMQRKPSREIHGL